MTKLFPGFQCWGKLIWRPWQTNQDSHEAEPGSAIELGHLESHELEYQSYPGSEPASQPTKIIESKYSIIKATGGGGLV